MSTAQPSPMHRIKIWLREETYQALATKAEQTSTSQSAIVRRSVSRVLGEDAEEPSAPWLADMLDAVLSSRSFRVATDLRRKPHRFPTNVYI